MQANTISFGAGPAISAGLGVAGAVLVYAVLTDRSPPLVGSDRVAFFALAVIGLAMCSLGGIGQTAVPLGWAHPLTLFGSVLGVLALALAGAVAIGRTGFLAPLGAAIGMAPAAVSGERLAVIALGLIMLIKWLVGLTKFFIV